MLRGAILGFGNVAVEGHLPGWLRRPDVEIVAATDVLAARRTILDSRLPGARWYASAETLLDDTAVDFVDICTPPSSHAALVLAALGRGAHVLCEKPLVGSMEDLDRVLGAAAQAGRVLHTVHNWHHAPIVGLTARLLSEGAIGRVQRLVWHTLRTKPAAVAGSDGPNWRVDPAIAGGGVLSDHGWHVFYLLLRWAGELPTAVSARLETRRHAGVAVEDTATVEIEFPGSTAEVFLTWAADNRRNWAEVTGSAGTITLEDDTVVVTTESVTRRWPCPPPLSDGSFHPDRFDAVASRFLEAVTGAPRDLTNVTEASVCVALEHAARESSRRGGARVGVAVPEIGSATLEERVP